MTISEIQQEKIEKGVAIDLFKEYIRNSNFLSIDNILTNVEKIMDYLYPKDKPESEDFNEAFRKTMEAGEHTGIVMVDWDKESEKQRNSGSGLHELVFGDTSIHKRKYSAASDPSNFVQPGVNTGEADNGNYTWSVKSDGATYPTYEKATEYTITPKYDKETSFTIEKGEDEVKMVDDRRTGKTTRAVDNVIQRLFEGEKIYLKNYENTNKDQDTLYLKVINRLKDEHNMTTSGIEFFWDEDERSFTMQMDFRIIELYKHGHKNGH